MDFDGDDGDGDMSDEEDLPSSIIVNRNDEQLSPIAPHLPSEHSSASKIQQYKLEEGGTGFDESDDNNDDDDDDVSTSSSASSGSLELNPTSPVDKLDIPGIALLKEIFPEETTTSLRKMHYKHIMLNKTSLPSVSLPVPPEPSSGEDSTKNVTNSSNETSRETGDYDQENDRIRTQNSASRRMNIPVVDLPDIFLRLPKSVAVLRQRQRQNDNEKNNGQTYEFVKDLEMRALEEYHLAGTNQQIQPGQKYVEYNTFVVDKDDRCGLGMTLQEVLEEWNPLGSTEQQYLNPSENFHTVIRYGLQVIGFVSDPKKNQKRESPAEAAGIQCDDVVIGINGTAFLLEVSLSSSSRFTVDRRSDHYKIQKERIIRSIQNSPTPAVLHIRRRRERSSIEKSFSERNVTSLLDASMEQEDLQDALIENFAEHATHDVPPLQPSPSSAFYHTKPAAVPRKKSPTIPHPLSVALAQRKLIRPGEDQWRITRRLQQFTERARQCESSNSLRIFLTRRGGSEKGSLAPHFDPTDLPPDMAALMIYQKDEAEHNEKIVQSPDDITNIDDKSNPLDSSVSKNYDGESKDQSEDNILRKATCTPSTPTLPFDSPLIPMAYLQAFYGDRQAREIRSKSNTTTRFDLENQFSLRRNSDDMAWIPLHGIRKGLSARIVNSFVESAGSNPTTTDGIKSRIAYTIWVYDIESGREWYAPIRYWKDFSDLREAALSSLPTNSNMHRELSMLKFAKDPAIPNENNSGWSVAVFGSPSMSSPMSTLQQRRRKRKNDEFDEARQQTSQSLEEFLRELLGIIYTCNPLHTSTAEIALYVQSFLGVDAGLEDQSELDIHTFETPSDRLEDETQQLLKRSIQRYSWRIFLLHTMKAIVKDFVDAARARGPKLHEIESMDVDTKGSLKARAMEELLQIQKFLDQLVDLILDGCSDDLQSIAERREYFPIHKNLADETYWDRLVREAVREQVEIEVYVPLRSVVSRLVVNGWRHEDMEVHFKIQELRKRPQGMFRIEKTSPSHWQSVARILKQGVGMSTLPCVKLRAIVDAAREISRLHEREHNGHELLGADEFLPIFIFCVVRAEMERPCALKILLQTLCDRINRIGEIGYFLASFEAAIAHIKEIDLTEDRDDMLSFLTVPLTEVPLNDE